MIDIQNAAVSSALAELGPMLGVDFITVDLNGLFGEIFADPSSFNVLSLAQPPYLSLPYGDPEKPGEFAISVNPNLPRFDNDRTLFWDNNHLTAAGHDIASAFFAATLQDQLAFLSEEDDVSRAPPCARTDNVIFARAGDDRLETGAGRDVAFGGLGNDRVGGGASDDIVVGGSGNDVLSGGVVGWGHRVAAGGSDILSGGEGDDLIWGGGAADFLSDGLGSDVVLGQAGDDVLVHVDEALLGGPEDSADTDFFNGGAGHDKLLLFLADETAQAAAIEAATAGAGRRGLHGFEIGSLGIKVANVERVVVLGERRLPFDLDLPEALADRVKVADAWNAIPLSADGPLSVASDAVFDSDGLYGHC